jgi:hypothetical protein
VCAEASIVLRVVAVDFFFNCCYLEIPSDNYIWHIPKCVHCHEQAAVYSRCNNDPRTLPWGMPALTEESSVYSFSTFIGRVFYANRILG